MCLFPSQYKTGAFHAGAVRSHELPVQIKHNRARAEQVCVCLVDASVQTDEADVITSLC